MPVPIICLLTYVGILGISHCAAHLSAPCISRPNYGKEKSKEHTSHKTSLFFKKKKLGKLVKNYIFPSTKSGFKMVIA